MVTAPPRRLARMPRLRVATPALRAPTALVALGLAAAVAYAAFADGAIELPNEARLQVGVAALALLALAAWSFAARTRVAAPRAGWAALAALALFTVWTGVSFAWSIAPDRTWAELNRALDYTLVLTLAVAIGATLPRAL